MVGSVEVGKKVGAGSSAFNLISASVCVEIQRAAKGVADCVESFSVVSKAVAQIISTYAKWGCGVSDAKACLGLASS